jgi:SSS family solute:Na+ symporter
VYIAGGVFAILCALGITRIQGLNFFNIFQSVLGFLELPMASAFLLSVFWKRSTRRAMNLLLTTGTIFSLETGIHYFSGLILAKFHFLLILFLIFVTPTVVTITIIVLTEKANKKQQPQKPLSDIKLQEKHGYSGEY